MSRLLPPVLVLLVALHPATAGAASGPQGDGDPDAEGAVAQIDLRDLVALLLGRDDGTEADAEAPSSGTDGEGRLSIFPTISVNPATGVAMGAIASFTDYVGEPAETRLSSILASAAYSTRKQLLLAVRSDLYLRGDRWQLAGDIRYYDFVERTHGLGSDSPASPASDVDYRWFRFHQLAYREVLSNLRVGGGYHLDVHEDLELDTPDAGEPAPVGAPTTVSSGLSAALLFDSRDNPINAGRGTLARAGYSWYRRSLGSDSDWNALELEGRAFRALPPVAGGRAQGLAFWAIGEFTDGDPPYFDLPSIGWDTYGRTGRGYRAGRYRGRDWGYVEAEYRTVVTRNGLIGAVGFVNASTLSDANGDFGLWAIGGGGGLRVKLDKERGSNLAIDVAWGREGSRGVYFALNEAF